LFIEKYKYEEMLTFRRNVSLPSLGVEKSATREPASAGGFIATAVKTSKLTSLIYFRRTLVNIVKY
jgi:hypothetical protein